MPKDYYLVLGVPADSTLREIKTAYRRLAKEFHPDRCSDRHTTFLVIQEAYTVLKDPVRRREYDETRREAGKRQAASRNYSSFSTVEPLVPKRQPASREVEVAITQQQAYRGGIVRLLVPARMYCSACGGSGAGDFFGFFACPRCGGKGTLIGEHPLRLEFPPGVPDNVTIRLPLDRFGLANSTLTLRFRIRS